MPVVREICSREDHQAAKEWCYAHVAARHVPVPELQMSAPGVIPGVIQINKHVDAAMNKVRERRYWVLVEIRVDLERPARYTHSLIAP